VRGDPIALFIVLCALILAVIGCAVLTPPPGQATDGADERALEAITLSVF
jgi:hypothetical protein